MSKAWSAGSSRAWRHTRAQVLARDRYRCQLQLPGVCTHAATCVHHTLGRAITGDDPAYLVAACEPCNRKGGQTDGCRQGEMTTGGRGRGLNGQAGKRYRMEMRRRPLPQPHSGSVSTGRVNLVNREVNH